MHVQVSQILNGTEIGPGAYKAARVCSLPAGLPAGARGVSFLRFGGMLEEGFPRVCECAVRPFQALCEWLCVCVGA